MSRRAISLMLLLAQCTPELTTVGEASSEPRFLGELAGFYDLSAVTILGPNATELDPVPLPMQLMVMHLVNPAGAIDPVVAVITTAGDGKIDGDEMYIGGGYDDGIFVGTTDTELLVVAERPPGGSALTIAESVAICPDGPRYPAFAERQCNFSSALSGVYQGEATHCSTGVKESRFMALGFRDENVVGLSYPNTSRLLMARYDRFLGTGFGLLPDLGTTGHIDCLTFGVSETSGVITVDATVGDFAPLTSGCSLDPCVETLSLTRLSGGNFEACDGIIPSAPLDIEIVTTTQGEDTLLDVRVAGADEDGSAEPFRRPTWPVTVIVREGPEGPNLSANYVDAPDDATARFTLPAVSTPLQLEVWARLGSAGNPSAAYAVPVCVEYDGIAVTPVFVEL